MSTELAVQTQNLEMTYRSLGQKSALALVGVSLEVERGVIFGLPDDAPQIVLKFFFARRPR